MLRITARQAVSALFVPKQGALGHQREKPTAQSGGFHCKGMITSMKLRPIAAVAALALCFAFLPSCELAKDLLDREETSDPSVSVAPVQFMPEDTQYPEPIDAYINRTGEQLWARNSLPSPTPFPTSTPESDPIETPEEPEPTYEPIEFVEFEELEDLERLELVSLIGETVDGLYYVAVTQRGLSGYIPAAGVSAFNADTQYKLAYQPDSNVNQPTLALLESVVPDVLIEPLLSQTDSYLAELENPGKTNQPAYLPNEWLLLDVRTAIKLTAACDALAAQNLRLKVVGGYYPQSIQYKLYNAVGNERLVPNPKEVSRNAQGLAVDVVLVDSAGRELAFPTDIYTYTDDAVSPYTSAEDLARQNAQLLREVMENAGFTAAPENWWQFYDSGVNYMISNVPYSDMTLTVADKNW